MDRQVIKGSFKSRQNLSIFSTDLTLEGSIFQTLGAPIAKKDSFNISIDFRDNRYIRNR